MQFQFNFYKFCSRVREENHLLSLLELDMFLVWNTIIFDSLPMKVSIRNGAVPSTKAVKRPS